MEKHYRPNVNAGSMNLTQIIAIVLLAAILITLFTPWIYIGIKANGKNYDLSRLLRASYIDSVSSLVDELVGYSDYGSNSSKVKFAAKMGVRLGKKLQDSKLSMAELPGALFNITCIMAAAEADGTFLMALCTLIFAVLFFATLYFIGMGLWRAIKYKKPVGDKPLVVYAVTAGTVILITLILNAVVKKKIEDSFLAYAFYAIDSTNYSILHLRFMPFFGLILAAALKFGPRYAGRIDLSKANLPKVNMSNIKVPNVPVKGIVQSAENRVGWKCECGSFNLYKAQFCPKCGRKRPNASVCPACGAQLKKGSQFCHVCGTRVANADQNRPAE